MAISKLGVLLALIGVVVGVFGKGWITLLIGIGFCVLGVIIGQIAEIYLSNQMKCLNESLTAKRAHELVARHLRERGDDVDATEVFLGKYVEELEYQERQKKQ